MDGAGDDDDDDDADADADADAAVSLLACCPCVMRWRMGWSCGGNTPGYHIFNKLRIAAETSCQPPTRPFPHILCFHP